MTRALQVALVVAAAIIALLAGVLIADRLRDAPPSREAELALTSKTFTDLSGNPIRLGDFGGQVLVVNFWATWCAPCREEIPGLIEVHRAMAGKGAQVIGIAIDSHAKVSEYLQSMPIPYPIVLADGATIDLMRQLGNGPGGLPFTVFVDAKGTVVARHLGLIRPEEILRHLRPRVG